MENDMKIWIARDEAVVPEDMGHYIERHPEEKIRYSKLHIFYDKPIWCGFSIWGGARQFEISNYMFPEIQCGECVEFISNNKFNKS